MYARLPAAGSAGSAGSDPWGFIGAVLLCVAVIAGMLLLLRLFSRAGLGRQSRYLRVLDRFPVSRDCQILVLGVGARVLVVCVGREGGGLLCELDPVELNLKAAGPSAPPASGGELERSTFWERFWHNLRLNMRLLPKGAKPMYPTPKARSGDEDTEAFAAILEAVRRQQKAEETAQAARDPVPPPPPSPPRNPEGGSGGGNPSPIRSHPAADYRAAVENMRRLAQTDPVWRGGSAPAARPLPPSAGETDGDAARELLRVLSERPGRHETAKPAYTKPVPRSARDDAIDDILDSIAKRRSRYGKRDPR